MGLRDLGPDDELLHALADKTAGLPSKFVKDGKEFVVTSKEHLDNTKDAILNAVKHIESAYGADLHEDK